MNTTPTAASASTQTTSAETPVMTLTPGAVAQVKQVMAEQGFADAYLVVRVVPAGCSGLGYDLNLLKELQKGDLTWEQDGVKMATDAMSKGYLAGTVVDFLKMDTHAGFKFNNPNAKSTCGCGTSFSA